MKVEILAITAVALLVVSILVLIAQSPEESPKSMSFEKYSEELVQINELSKKYYLEDDARYEDSKRKMQEKLKEISSVYLGLEISQVELLEGYYPFNSAADWAERFNLELLSVCEFEKTIPLHMKVFSKTENFEIFAKKYSSYKLELSIQDERSYKSNIHYGLAAISENNQRASTYFHVNSCTGEITDREPYFLHCYDEADDYRFVTFNRDDILSSYSGDNFCKIELDSWRQSVFDYSKTLDKTLRVLERQAFEDVVDHQSQLEFIDEIERQGDLKGIVWSMIHGKFDEQDTRDRIEQYGQKYRGLPEELAQLIENRS